MTYVGNPYLLFPAAGGASFPQVADVTASSQDTANANPASVDMPTTVNSGELLLICIAAHNTGPPDLGTPSGWTELATNTDDSSSEGLRGSVYAKAADGTEGGTTVDIAATPAAADSWAAHVYRITSWHGTVSGGAEANADGGGAGNSSDPPSLTPSWGSANTLWIAGIATADDADDVSAYPTNYTNGQQNHSGAAGNAASIATARRELAASSEDPGAFTMTVSDQTVIFTIGVRPA